jgi:hypothetical protein
VASVLPSSSSNVVEPVRSCQSRSTHRQRLHGTYGKTGVTFSTSSYRAGTRNSNLSLRHRGGFTTDEHDSSSFCISYAQNNLRLSPCQCRPLTDTTPCITGLLSACIYPLRDTTNSSWTFFPSISGSSPFLSSFFGPLLTS